MNWDRLLKLFDLAAPQAKRGMTPAPGKPMAPLVSAPPGQPVAKEYEEPDLSPLGKLAVKLGDVSSAFYGAGGTNPLLGHVSSLVRVAALIGGNDLHAWEKWNAAKENSPTAQLVPPQPPPLPVVPQPLRPSPPPLPVPSATASPAGVPPAPPVSLPPSPGPIVVTGSAAPAGPSPASMPIVGNVAPVGLPLMPSPMVLPGVPPLGTPQGTSQSAAPPPSPSPSPSPPLVPGAATLDVPEATGEPVSSPAVPPARSANPATSLPAPAPLPPLADLIPKLVGLPGAKKLGLTPEVLGRSSESFVRGLAGQLGLTPSPVLPSPGLLPSTSAKAATVLGSLPSPGLARTPFPSVLDVPQGGVPPTSSPPWTAGGQPRTSFDGLSAIAPGGRGIGVPAQAGGGVVNPDMREVVSLLREILAELRKRPGGKEEGSEPSDESESQENRRPLWRKVEKTESASKTPHSSHAGIELSIPSIMRPPMLQDPDLFKL